MLGRQLLAPAQYQTKISRVTGSLAACHPSVLPAQSLHAWRTSPVSLMILVRGLPQWACISYGNEKIFTSNTKLNSTDTEHAKQKAPARFCLQTVLGNSTKCSLTCCTSSTTFAAGQGTFIIHTTHHPSSRERHPLRVNSGATRDFARAWPKQEVRAAVHGSFLGHVRQQKAS